MGIVTKVIAKLTPLTEVVKTLLAVFDTVEDASQTVSDIIASGVIPAALEMMDHLSIQAVEQATRAGYPTDAGAVLLVEVDGLRESVDELSERVDDICRQHGAREIRSASTPAERE